MTSFVDITTPQQMVALLGNHSQIAYAVLFLGAFFETLIPFSLIVLGEVFFLAGALLAGMGALDLWLVMTALYAGGIGGDNLSYWLGRHYGIPLFGQLARWPWVGRVIHDANHQRGMEFFERRGAMAVLIARLSGPLSWVTPAMAGVFRLNYATFVRFNALGVIIGIGEFILIGYFFGNHLPAILAWFSNMSATIALIAALIAVLGFCSWYYLTRLKARKGI